MFEIGERVHVDMGQFLGGEPYEMTSKEGKTLSFTFAVGAKLEGIVRDISDTEIKLEMRIAPLVGEIINVPQSVVSKKS